MTAPERMPDARLFDLQRLEHVVRTAVGEPSRPEALEHRGHFIIYKLQETPSLSADCRA